MGVDPWADEGEGEGEASARVEGDDDDLEREARRRRELVRLLPPLPLVPSLARAGPSRDARPLRSRPLRSRPPP